MVLFQPIQNIQSGPIVLIDDERKERLLASCCFSKSKLFQKYDLLLFNDGPSFLDHLESKVAFGLGPMPILVLIDIHMPGTNGLTVLAKIRCTPLYAKLPLVIMFTLCQSPRDFDKSKKLGANGYCTKPFSFDEYITFFNSLPLCNA